MANGILNSYIYIYIYIYYEPYKGFWYTHVVLISFLKYNHMPIYGNDQTMPTLNNI